MTHVSPGSQFKATVVMFDATLGTNVRQIRRFKAQRCPVQQQQDGSRSSSTVQFRRDLTNTASIAWAWIVAGRIRRGTVVATAI